MATLTMLYVTDIVDTGHGLSLDDLERLKVKVTNGTVTAIGMWGYTPVVLTGVLVYLLSSPTRIKGLDVISAKFEIASACHRRVSE